METNVDQVIIWETKGFVSYSRIDSVTKAWQNPHRKETSILKNSVKSNLHRLKTKRLLVGKQKVPSVYWMRELVW